MNVTDSVEYFVHCVRWSCYKFISNQLLHIPPRIWDEAKVGEDEDIFVLAFSRNIFVKLSQLKFQRLMQVAKVVLITPTHPGKEILVGNSQVTRGSRPWLSF